MEPNSNYERAKKRVEEEKGFYSHILTYVVVITGLIILDYLTSGGKWWWWPAIGWGIGLLMHGIGVFGYNPFLGKDWEERRMRQLMDKDEE